MTQINYIEQRKNELLEGPHLELVLTGHWFRMIESRKKKHEYRELKEYWWKRIFTSPFSPGFTRARPGYYNGRFATVRFRLGYKRDPETMIWKLGHQGIGIQKEGISMNQGERAIDLELTSRLK